MARSLAHTLTRLTPISPSSLSSGARLVTFRNRSDKVPGFGNLERDEQSEMENMALKNLEDAVNRIVVKRSEPRWIVFAPGASYWVPPKVKASGYAEVMEKLAESDRPLSPAKKVKKERALSRAYNRGWPSSAYYFKGASHSPVEGEMTPNHVFQSEEEEGILSPVIRYMSKVENLDRCI